MRLIYLVLIVLLNAFALSAQAPTGPTTNIDFNNVTGGSTRMSITIGNGERRIVVVSLNPITGLPQDMVDYNPDLIFGDGDEIATGEYVMFDGVRPNFDVFRGFTPDTEYHVAVFEYNGEDQQTEYLTTSFDTTFNTLGPPTMQASNVGARFITGNSATIFWENGNGDGRTVVFREGEPVTANPIDLEAYGNLGSSWQSGDEITPGNRVMFNTSGSRDTFLARNLEPSTEYHFDVFEWAGPGGQVYAVPGASGSFTTADRPNENGTIRQANTITEGDRVVIDYTPGNGEGRLFVLKEGSSLAGVQPTDGIAYTANTDFGSGDEVAPGAFAVVRFNFRPFGNVNLPDFTVQNLEPATTYTIGIYEFDYTQDNTVFNYQTESPVTLTFTTASAPTVQASNPVIENQEATTVDLSWTRGNGNASFLVMRADVPVTFDPTDTDTYATQRTFGTRALGDGHFGIARGATQPVMVTNLTPGVTYHCAVWEYNGNSGPVYTRPPLTFSFTAPLAPTVSTSAIRFVDVEGDRLELGWTVGNGQRRIIVAKADSPVTAEPVDGNAYDQGGSVFGMGTELAPGEFVVADNNFNGIISRSIITGLEISTVYHFAMFEYNEDENGVQYYRRADPARASQSTATVPTVTAPAFGAQELNAVSIRFVPEVGDGNGRYLVMKEGTAVDFTPVNLVRYRTSRIFGNEVVGNDNASIQYFTRPAALVDIEQLLANTLYHAALFEHNGTNQPVYNTSPATYSFTTPRYPTESGSGFETRDVGATRVQAQFFRGNGASRIVVARLATNASAAPSDNTTYTADDVFGQGTDLGGGNFVVHQETFYRPGLRETFVVSGLEPGTDYVFTTYEVAANRTETFYRVPGLELALTTSSEPTVAPINLQVNDILNESATIAWTTGNGQGEFVLLSENAPVSELASTGTLPVTSSTFSTTGPRLGNAQPVYFGPQTEVNVARLTPGTPYYVQLQAYNGWRQSPAYMQSGPTIMFRTPGAPSQQASNATVTGQSETRISLAWDKGNGTDRIVVAKKGSAVDAEPVDNESYTPNTFFGSGDDLGGGNFVIAAGDFDTISVTDLIAGMEYFFKVFEFNEDASILYNRDDPAVVSAVAETVLPVTWKYFRGRALKNDVELNWATVFEENADEYIIERRSQATEFSEIGATPAIGAGSYNFLDRHLDAGNYFYRLRQTDLDGALSYSSIVSVAVGELAQLTVYPIPVGDRLYVGGAGLVNGEPIAYELANAVGTIIRRGKVTRDGIPVASLRPGVYYLRVGESVVPVIK